jgi:hypothetical protein
MRSAFAALVILGVAALTAAQPPKEAPKEPPKEPPKEAPKEPPKKDVPKDESEPVKDLGPRYGVNPRVKAYPQATPKEALRSALLAIERVDYSYLAAQLLDPALVDKEVGERAKSFELDALAELTRLRDFQRANPGRVMPEERLPLDAKSFGALVLARAREQALRQLAKDLEQKLTDDPVSVKEMRRILRHENAFNVADPIATATHPDVKGRTLYFKKIGERWFLENRNTEEPKKEP